MSLDYQVGVHIARLRKEKGMTLQTLAQRSHLTKGYLSKVEHGQKVPPVSTLSRIATALNAEIADFFEHPEILKKITMVRANERQPISRSGSAYGYNYESIAYKHGSKLMEPFILTFFPNTKINKTFTHEGEEMIFVLEGTMLFIHGEDRLVCEEGDSIYFDASVPHRGESMGKKETRVLIVMASGRPH